MDRCWKELETAPTDVKKREYLAILRNSGVIARVSEILSKMMQSTRPRNALAFFVGELKGDRTAEEYAKQVNQLELELEHTHREIRQLECLIKQISSGNSLPLPPANVTAYDSNGNLITLKRDKFN